MDMKILAIEKEIKNSNNSIPKQMLKDEAREVWRYYKSGIIREIYFAKEDHCAVIILECKNKSEAKKILDKFPLVKNKLIEFQIIPLSSYDGLERMFK